MRARVIAAPSKTHCGAVKLRQTRLWALPNQNVAHVAPSWALP